MTSNSTGRIQFPYRVPPEAPGLITLHGQDAKEKRVKVKAYLEDAISWMGSEGTVRIGIKPDY